MPMDEYDLGHSAYYKKIINVYRNSDVDEMLRNIQKNTASDQNLDIFVRDLNDTVNKLKAALDILDQRTITCICGRVVYAYKLTDNAYHQEWYLVNVWRGNDPTKFIHRQKF